jgi:uncharacterized protein
LITAAANERADNSRALIIFAKQPAPGAVKTRLAPPLTPESAAELYACMLHDTLAMAMNLAGITPFIFYQDAPDAAGFFAVAAPGIAAAPQRGENLGKRMKAAFTELFARGFSKIAIIGSDSPDLPPEYVFEAFTQLEYEHTDVVFGPAADGGYYLLALKRVWDELFINIPWSSAAVLAASAEKAKDAHLGVALLPLWYDLDIPADLERPALLDGSTTAVRTGEFLRRTLLPVTGESPPDSHSPAGS